MNCQKLSQAAMPQFKALVKDEIQKGANVPLEELGVNRVVEATIKEVVK